MATNILGIGIGIANAIGFNKFKMGDIASLKPIASYRCYDKTNDDADRDVLTDLTGNGHDIQLYNFAFAENSGYGLYNENFNNLQYNNSAVKEKTASKVIIYNTEDVKTNIYSATSNLSIGEYNYGGYNLKISGLNDNESINMLCIFGDNFSDRQSVRLYNGHNYIEKRSVNVTESNSGYRTFFDIQTSEILNKEITFEIIPEYQGALVSDGVDDYGLCENFPALTIEKGFTIIGIRKCLNTNKQSTVFAIGSNAVVYNNNSAAEVMLANNRSVAVSFTKPNYLTDASIADIDFFSLTSVAYNGEKIIKGIDENYNGKLFIFTNKNSSLDWTSSVALYALEIYDRDLTDEEIAAVKARMIAEYEEKTGNKYEEETT